MWEKLSWEGSQQENHTELFGGRVGTCSTRNFSAVYLFFRTRQKVVIYFLFCGSVYCQTPHNIRTIKAWRSDGTSGEDCVNVHGSIEISEAHQELFVKK